VNDHFEAEHRSVYFEALDALRRSGVPFMVGGAFAVWHYTGLWRNTHDIDVYVVQDDVARAAAALDSAGFADLGEQAPGDDQWIYHSRCGDLIFDVIWRFANLVNHVKPDWFERASVGEFLDLELRFLPLEEFLWIKVFVINRHRCDWPDVMHMIQAQCRAIDWPRLLSLLGEHWLLFASLIDLFDWQFPQSMGCIPDSVRDELAERRLRYREDHPVYANREHLLDPWLHLRADGYAIRRDE